MFTWCQPPVLTRAITMSGHVWVEHNALASLSNRVPATELHAHVFVVMMPRKNVLIQFKHGLDGWMLDHI